MSNAISPLSGEYPNHCDKEDIFCSWSCVLGQKFNTEHLVLQHWDWKEREAVYTANASAFFLVLLNAKYLSSRFLQGWFFCSIYLMQYICLWQRLNIMINSNYFEHPIHSNSANPPWSWTLYCKAMSDTWHVKSSQKDSSTKTFQIGGQLEITK